MRAKYVLWEAATGLWRNVTMTIAMIITMAVSLTMLGASGLLFLQVGKVRDLYHAQIEVSIFLQKGIDDEQRTNLNNALDNDPLVASFYYESQEDAYEKFKSLFQDQPELVSNTSPESLPESFRVKLVNPEQYREVNERYRDVEGVGEIVDQQQLVDRILAVLSAVQAMALIAAVVMATAALLLVANTIQVAAYSKRREVAVMKLVGASNWFIQAPFVLEAVVAGVFGALLASGALALGKALILDGPLQPLTTFLTPVPWQNIVLSIPILAAVGAVVSAVTGWITLRFYLKA